jgi:hypothetical protein
MRLELLIIIEFFLCQQYAVETRLSAEQNHGRHGHPFALTSPTELFRGRCFDTDLVFPNVTQAGNILSDPAVVWRKFWSLGNHRHVGVDQPKTLMPHDAEHIRQQFTARDIFVARIAIRKMRADVPLAHGAEKRVHQRVQHCVGIRVPGKALVVGNFHTAQDELAAAAETVHVKSMSDAKFLWHDLE